MNKTIHIACKTGFTAPLDAFNEFQGDLKELTEVNFSKLAKEIEDTGFAFAPHMWTNPEDNKLYTCDGHQRLHTVRRMVGEMGFQIGEIPYVPVEAPSFKDAKRRVLQAASQYGHITESGLAHFLFDVKLDPHQVGLNFEFPEIDLRKLSGVLSNLSGTEIDVTGHTRVVGKIGDDEVPEIKEPFVKPGEIWQLGSHKLLCGDSTSKEQVATLMNSEKADLLLTDPPYGVSYIEKNAAVHGGMVKNNIGKTIANDTGTVEEMAALWGHLFSHADHFTDEASYYVFSPQGGELMMMMMMQAIHQSKWQLKHSLIWQKQNFVFGRCDYHYQHEPVLYGWKKKGTHNWYADRSQSSLLQFDKPHRSDLHPTTKPVDILEYLIGNSSKEKDLVVDLFGGSGSTLIACEKTGRRCLMSEIDPHYCSVIIDRWEKFTGLEAKKISGP